MARGETNYDTAARLPFKAVWHRARGQTARDSGIQRILFGGLQGRLLSLYPPERAVTELQTRIYNAKWRFRTVTDGENVTGRIQQKPNVSNTCNDVTDRKGAPAGEGVEDSRSEARTCNSRLGQIYLPEGSCAPVRLSLPFETEGNRSLIRQYCQSMRK